jgi:hypothetical protein
LIVASPAAAQLSFGPPANYQVPASPQAITTADLDGDTLPDVIVGTSSGISVFINNGDGTFSQPVSYATPAPATVVSADFDGDGLADVAFAGSGVLGVMLNLGDGSLASPVFYPGSTGVPNFRQTSLTYGDYYHDGHVHLALLERQFAFFGSRNYSLTVFKNRGDGSFTRVPQPSPDAGAVSVVTADLNNDGYPDLITGGGDCQSGCAAPNVSIMFNLRDGTFSSPVAYPVSAGAGLAVADLNHDGNIDIVFWGADSRIGVMINIGGGIFGPPSYYDTGYDAGQVYNKAGQFNIAGVTFANLTGAGNLDLVADGGTNAVVLLNAGDGTFSSPIVIAAGTLASGPLTAVDLDGNGADDLIVSDIGANPAADAITVIANHSKPASVTLRLTPDHGGNAGAVTITSFLFTGIPTGSSAKLACPGQPDIQANGTTISADGKRLIAAFNLVGASPGQCDIVIVKPDGTTVVGAEKFTVDQGGSPQLWVDIVGFTNLRGGVPEQYFIMYGNHGTVDAFAGTGVWVDVPAFVNYATPLQAPNASWQFESEKALLYELGPIPAGTAGFLLITLTAPDDPQYAHQPFQVQVWLNAR